MGGFGQLPLARVGNVEWRRFSYSRHLHARVRWCGMILTETCYTYMVTSGRASPAATTAVAQGKDDPRARQAVAQKAVVAPAHLPPRIHAHAPGSCRPAHGGGAAQATRIHLVAAGHRRRRRRTGRRRVVSHPETPMNKTPTVIKLVCASCSKHLHPDNFILCSDCMIDLGESEFLCGASSCIDAHERRVSHNPNVVRH
jgi:hypothetical protein